MVISTHIRLEKVRFLPPQPDLFGSQALMVKHTALTRKNTDRYRGGPPNNLMGVARRYFKTVNETTHE